MSKLSIAYTMKKKAKKLAHGGGAYQSPCTAHCNHPCEVHPQASGFVEHEGNTQRPDGDAMSEDSRKLNQHGAHEEGRQGHEGHYAKGGKIKHSRESGINPEIEKGMSDAGQQARGSKEQVEVAKDLHRETLEDMRRDKRDRKYMAEGGFINGGYNETQDEDPRDMVGKIMAQRQQEYSKGGQVANQEHGHNDNEMADFSPNEFDDLVLRDNDMEEAEYTGANSGDEKGNSGEDKRRKDIVSKVMASRRKKDKLPNPR